MDEVWGVGCGVVLGETLWLMFCCNICFCIYVPMVTPIFANGYFLTY